MTTHRALLLLDIDASSIGSRRPPAGRGLVITLFAAGLGGGLLVGERGGART